MRSSSACTPKTNPTRSALNSAKYSATWWCVLQWVSMTVCPRALSSSARSMKSFSSKSPSVQRFSIVISENRITRRGSVPLSPRSVCRPALIISILTSVGGRKLPRTMRGCFLYTNSDAWRFCPSGPKMATSLNWCFTKYRQRRRLSTDSKSGPVSRTISILTRPRKPSMRDCSIVSGSW